MKEGNLYRVFRNENINYALFLAAVYFLTYVFVRFELGYYHVPPEFIPVDVTLLIEGIRPAILLAVVYIVFCVHVDDPMEKWMKHVGILLVLTRLGIIGMATSILALYLLLEISILPLLAWILIPKKRRTRLYQKLRYKALQKKLKKLPYNLHEYFRKLDYYISIYLYFINQVQRFYHVKGAQQIIEIFKPQSRHFVKYLLISLIALIICADFGRSLAKDQDTYRFIELSNNGDKSLFVIMGRYKDSFVVAPVDLKRKEITPHYRLVDFKTKPDESRAIYSETVGHLRVKSVKLPDKYKADKGSAAPGKTKDVDDN